MNFFQVVFFISFKTKSNYFCCLGSLEISPKMVEMIYKSDLNSSPGSSKIREDLAEAMQERGETRLREDLADAMMEGPRSLNRTSGM